MLKPVALAGQVRVMARPSFAKIEEELVRLACEELGAKGSKSSMARLIAKEVAALAIMNLRRGPFDFDAEILIAQERLSRPALARLATDDGIETGEIARSMALEQFEANGCRHLQVSEIALADRQLHGRLETRLADRYRRRLKKF